MSYDAVTLAKGMYEIAAGFSDWNNMHPEDRLYWVKLAEASLETIMQASSVGEIAPMTADAQSEAMTAANCWHETEQVVKLLAKLDAFERLSDRWSAECDEAARGFNKAAGEIEDELDDLRREAVDAAADTYSSDPASDEWLDAWDEADSNAPPVKQAISLARRTHAGDSYLQRLAGMTHQLTPKAAPAKEHPMTSNRPVSEMVCPFDETVTHELEVALDNYADDPDDNGALNRLANNCVTIGYEFALRATPQPLSDDVVVSISEVICDYLDERFPEGALPGGKQLFADDHLDAEFKHEAGCDQLAERILAALQAVPASGEVGVREALDEAVRRYPDAQAGLTWFAAASGLVAGKVTQEARDWAAAALKTSKGAEE